MNTTTHSVDEVRHMYRLFETFESVIDDPLFDSMVDRYTSNILISDCAKLQAAIDRILARKGKPVRKPAKPIRPVCRASK